MICYLEKCMNVHFLQSKLSMNYKLLFTGKNIHRILFFVRTNLTPYPCGTHLSLTNTVLKSFLSLIVSVILIIFVLLDLLLLYCAVELKT